MPHSLEYTKTKEGYLISVEEILGLKNNLPRRFYRMSIEQARQLYESVLMSGHAGFYEICTTTLNLDPIEGIE